NSMAGDFILEYTITPNLSFSTNNRAAFRNSKRELYYDVRSKAGAGQGRLTNDFENTTQLITSNRLSYAQKFGNHNFNAIAVAEAETNSFENGSMTGSGLAPGLHVMNAASRMLLGSGSNGDNAFSKGLVQLDYNYVNRYFLIGSLVRESSSRFGADNKAANFYTVGGSWIVSNETFLQNHRIFDLLKVRASYGLTGNAQIGDYQTLGLYSFSTQYAGYSGSYPFQLANTNLTWEKAKTVNFGLDIGFFKRATLNIDVYDKTTSELLLNTQLPYTTGFASVIQNVGSVQNKGLELNLNTLNINGQFKWETNFNVAFNRSKVLGLDQGKDILTIGTGFQPSRIISVDHDLNSWYMRKWAGVNPANGNPLWEKVSVDASGTKVITTTSVYNDATLQFVGTFTPKFTGGINNVFSYKALT
ncbi:MAG TPA: TonB-dependent receptor, partial [Niastella sp.]|nr:TonB-dependent receptor [Niastella sp.]